MTPTQGTDSIPTRAAPPAPPYSSGRPSYPSPPLLAPAVEKEQPREIHGVMAEIEEELRRLRTSIEELATQLQPVLVPADQELNKPTPEGPPPCSPIGDVLHRYHHEILVHRRTVQSLRRCLAI